MDRFALNIQWFPGHMTKAKRMIAENLKLVDIVCEIVDARIPVSSRNPELPALLGVKPRMVILNRIDLADPAITRRWRRKLELEGLSVLETDAKSGRGVAQFPAAVRSALKAKIAELKAKGQGGRPLRAMVLGIPNVGKSTFINKVARRKVAVAADRPGVTRGKQWIHVDASLDLLDTPGLLWPKFDSQEQGENLAFTGAIKDTVVDTQALASNLMLCLSELYPALLCARYKLEQTEGKSGFDLLEDAARKRGFRISGGEVDTERMAAVLLDEFRGGILGRISLERPEVDADA